MTTKLLNNSQVAVSPYGMHYHLPSCRAANYPRKIVAKALKLNPEIDFYIAIPFRFAKLIRNNHGNLYKPCKMCLGKEK